MVQVFDSFIKMYGRAPTEDEIVKMMKLKAEMEKKVNPHMRKPHVDTMTAQKLGKSGGAPKTGRKCKLTEPAKVVNRMIKRGMTMRDIGAILGKSHQAVSEMKRRYGLPREDVE